MNVVDESGLYGMYAVWHSPFWRTTSFYAFVALCGAVLVGVLGWYAYKKWFMRVQVRTLWEQALFSLTELDTSSLDTVEQRSQLYANIISILKRYLEQR